MPTDQPMNSIQYGKRGSESETSESVMRGETPLTFVIAVIMAAIVGVVITAGLRFGQPGDLVVGIIGSVMLVVGLLWRLRGGRITGTHDAGALERGQSR